jgi:hypothetical protein
MLSQHFMTPDLPPPGKVFGRLNYSCTVLLVHITFPSLRLTVCSELTEEEITEAANVIIETFDEHIK